jgi:hypothetical protein
VKRRLSNTQREKKGLPPLARRQIAQQVEHPDSLKLYMQFYETPGKLFSAAGKPFIARCNIYDPCYDLISMRFARKALAKKAAENLTIANRDAGEGGECLLTLRNQDASIPEQIQG